MSGNALSNAVHRALYGAAIVSTASLPAVATAQDGELEVLDEIVTTGSRIPVDSNLVSTSPVTSLDNQEIKFSGVTRVEDLLNRLPQVVPSLTGNDSNGSTGTATIDLRGLNSVRTLVLMNGHRMGFGNPFALSADINQIPGNLVERVEVLTGGASSTYGSDAVAGVVNFIMKDDFEGFDVSIQTAGYNHKNDNAAAQQAIADRGFEQAPGTANDGTSTDINVIIGVNAPDGRGNVTGYLGYRDIEAIKHSERDYSACALRGTSDSGVGTCGGSSTTPRGSFRNFDDIDGTLDLNDPNGRFEDRAGELYNYGPLNYFQRPDERYTAGLFGKYAVSDRVEAYAEFTWMDDRSLAQIAPSGTFFNNNFLNCDNPLMSDQQTTYIGCPDRNAGTTVPIYVGRRNVEGGPRFDDLQHSSSRQLLGFRGEFTDAWSFDAFFNHARLNYVEVYNNDLSITNIIRSLNVVDDGSGNAICQSAADGSDPSCVPYNIFQPNQITQEALDYINLPLFSRAVATMTQVVAYVNGDLDNVRLPTASNGLQLVFGAEYREDELTLDLDENYNNGNAAGQGGATADVSGLVDVTEFFTEAKLPLIQEKAFAEDLSLDLRYRYSDYNIGVDANTWNVGLAWAPVESFKLRGSVSRAVRAPNIRELFGPQTIGLWQGTDPCAGPTPALSEAQCALTGVPSGSYGNVAPSPADQYNGLFGGNPDLAPEESDSITVGLVWTPEFADGLAITLDYWQIEVADAISTIGPQTAIERCGETGDPAFCSLISRNQTNGNLWVGSGPDAPRVTATNINIGAIEVGGVDLNGTYAFEFGNNNELDFALRGSLLTQWDDTPQPGDEANDCKGFWGGACGRPRPEWKHTFSARWGTPVEGLDVRGAWRYVSEVKEFSQDRHTADAQNYFDLAAGYNFDGLGGAWRVSGGINNILDEEPPANGLFNTAPYSNGNTIPGTWDPLGRYWFLQLNYTIGE